MDPESTMLTKGNPAMKTLDVLDVSGALSKQSGILSVRPVENVIEVKDATIRFGKFTAVSRVILNVTWGEVFGLLGLNGSGKTTLIRALCGLLPLAEGSATVLGHNVAVDAERIRQNTG